MNNDKSMPRMSIKLTFIEPTSEEKKDMGYQRPLNVLEVNMINKKIEKKDIRKFQKGINQAII